MADLGGLGLKEQKAASFELVPAGDYRAIVTKSEMKPTKDGTGKRLNVTLQITGGQYQNRTLFDGFNVVNNSAQAQEISRAQLKALCIAVNVPDPQTSEQLHNKPLMIKVGIKKGQDGTDQNVIKSYKACVDRPSPAKPQNMIEEAFETQEEQPAAATTTAKKNPFA